MTDVREVFEMVTKQTEPDLDSWKQQEERQRRVSRNRKVGAIAVVAALVVGAIAFAIALPRQNDSTPGGTGQPSSQPRTPPFGAEIVGLDGSVIQEIPGVPADARWLRLSPDGGTIAFATYRGEGYQVATMPLDGGDVTVLTDVIPEGPSGADGVYGLTWSPSGGEIAYSSNGDLYVMNADGSQVRRITEGPAEDLKPAWSPDGSLIAYTSGSPGVADASGPAGGSADGEIWTVPAGGGTPVRLTNDDAAKTEPAWSPDGTQIVYFSWGSLWVMRSDGSEQRSLGPSVSDRRGANWSPSWSPDGTRIAFINLSDGYETGIVPAPEQGEGINRGDAPLLTVRILDVATGEVTRNLGVRVATDTNGPVWVSDSALLVNRYD